MLVYEDDDTRTADPTRQAADALEAGDARAAATSLLAAGGGDATAAAALRDRVLQQLPVRVRGDRQPPLYGRPHQR